MMNVTYLGDTSTIWRGVVFEPHLAVLVSDFDLIAKAESNPFFEVFAVKPEKIEMVDLSDLRKMAEELGVKLDRRWGAGRIQKAIDEALEA